MSDFWGTMKRGFDVIMDDPERITRNAKSQLNKSVEAAKKAGEKTAEVATRGKGLEPARNLRDTLLKAIDEVEKKKQAEASSK